MDYDKNEFTSLIRLLIDQQREIKGLIEDFAKDLAHLKEITEDIPVLLSQFENIRKEFDNEKRTRAECQGRVETKISDITQKKDVIKDRITNLESDLNRKIFNQSRYCTEETNKLRVELESKIDSKYRRLNESVRDIQQDIKKLTGEAVS